MPCCVFIILIDYVNKISKKITSFFLFEQLIFFFGFFDSFMTFDFRSVIVLFFI